MNSDKEKTSSDQSKFSRGIRDIESQAGADGKFLEAEQKPHERRDPEESKYNEAGQVRQDAIEDKNPEGSKISASRPQESL